MSKKSFILSSAGLKNLNYHQNYDKNFKFIFGDHEVKLLNIYAEFISPYVSHIHQTDPTSSSLYFPNKSSILDQTNNKYFSCFKDETFSLFENISQGELVELDNAQCFQLQIISILIKNYELYNKLDELFEKSKDDQRLKEELEFVSFFGNICDDSEVINFSKSIDYIASNFYLIEKQQIFDLPISVLYSILKNKELTIESEDSLLDLIEEFFNGYKDQDQSSLSKIDFYEVIDFDFLSENKFKEFIESFEPEKLSASLWDKLKRCFYVYIKSPKKPLSSIGDKNGFHRYTIRERLIEYDGQKEHAFNGIIHTLTKESNGNVDDKGCVKITSSSTNGSDYPKKAADLETTNSLFYSNDDQYPWLQYDFKQRKVCPTHYSIRSRHDGGVNDYNAKSWVIEGRSSDNENWTNLDSQQNSPFLNDKGAVHTFDIKSTENNKEGFRYLRFRYTGPNWANLNRMVISALEYFGRLIEE